MANILALETSGTSCSVAISRDGDVDQIFEQQPREHARKILPMVDSLLKRVALSLNDIDAIAFTRGPGSFTGLRIGFGVVQGLAFGADIPIIGVSTLQCLAYRAALAHGLQSGLVVPSLDARMGEVYWGIYRLMPGALPIAVLEDSAIAPRDTGAHMPASIDAAVGEGWELLDPPSPAPGIVDKALSADAQTLAIMAGDFYNRGLITDVLSGQLSYVRNEVSWKKRQRVRNL